MSIRKFYGKNSREALAQVKQALGEDAIIVANRSVNGRTEIIAMLDSDVEPASAASSIRTPNERPSEAHQPRSLLDYVAGKSDETPRMPAAMPPNATSLHATPRMDTAPSHNAMGPAIVELLQQQTAQQEQAYQLATQTLEDKMRHMMQEMRQMRSQFESQLHAMAWQHHIQHHPAKAQVLSRLLAASFSPALARQIAEKLPAKLDETRAMDWAREVLLRNLHTLENENSLLDRGGIYALVGPTGVGKTTTTAKLAARYVMKHGTEGLGLITTDSYRIGGYEQLRIYGKILGVMVYAVKDEEDLSIALKELKNKHMILVDTVGVSQRDQSVAAQLAMLNKAGSPIQKLLCLNATSTGETLTDVLRSYKKHQVSGCIVTKLDEAAAIGNVLDVLIREKMRLYYTTSGQRVPEDISLADKQALIEQVLRPNPASLPYQYLQEVLPLVVSQLASGAHVQEFGHASIS